MDLYRACQLAGVRLVEGEATRVKELNGFKEGDRVGVNDVSAKPPVTFNAKIKYLWDDAYAHLTFEGPTNPKFDQAVQDSGRVALQKCVRLDK